MTIILKHRVNTIRDIDDKLGAEIDIRDYNGDLVVSHCYPSQENISLQDFLKNFPRASFLAINVKSTEIEKDLKKILEQANHKKYFVFDFSIPYLRKAIKIGLICAFRLSEYEKDLHPDCKWVWLDCFHTIWYDENFVNYLRKDGLKVAVASPELHNRQSSNDELEKIRKMINNDLIDAICTDKPELWQID